MSEAPEKPLDPHFPTFVYSTLGKRLVNSPKDFAELSQATGVAWEDSPDKVQKPAAAPVIDWKAKYTEVSAQLEDMRKVNGDLVAKLLSKPEPVAAKEQAKKPEPKVEPKPDAK